MRYLLIILILLIPYLNHANKIIAGTGQQVNSLSKAVSLAKNGDTILLKAGTYKEGNVLITRSITLIGEKNTILDGENKTELITISGRKITVKNIRFQNAGYSSLHRRSQWLRRSPAW